MKKTISLLLALILCLSLCACASTNGSHAPSATETETDARTVDTTTDMKLAPQAAEDNAQTEVAIQALKDYIIENGMKFGNMCVYMIETELADVNFNMTANENSVFLSLSYNLGRLNSKTTQMMDTTILFLEGYEHQQPGEYYVYQKNAFTANGTETSFGAGIHLVPADFTVAPNLDFVDIQKTGNNANAEITDGFKFSAIDGLNTILELFSDFLYESSLDLTLKNFGFAQYQIDENRKSDIRSEAWSVEPVEPAPVSISIRSLVNNSAGTPELTLQFTNTGEKEIVALDFYVTCYDAYGEIVKGYGRYDVYAGTYQDSPIMPGKSSPYDWYWPMYGFDNTKSVKVAVIKYKLAGEEAVVIPESEYVWTE